MTPKFLNKSGKINLSGVKAIIGEIEADFSLDRNLGRAEKRLEGILKTIHGGGNKSTWEYKMMFLFGKEMNSSPWRINEKIGKAETFIQMRQRHVANLLKFDSNEVIGLLKKIGDKLDLDGEQMSIIERWLNNPQDDDDDDDDDCAKRTTVFDPKKIDAESFLECWQPPSGQPAN